MVEALDSVTIEFSIDGGDFNKLNLGPEQVDTFKARNGVRLRISDGGIVTVIHNGRDRGVPGSIGQTIELEYP